MGDGLVPVSSRYWVTQHGGARVQLIYRDLTLTTAFSITGAGNTIQNPWGRLSRLSVDDRSGLRPRQREGLVDRHSLRFLEGPDRGAERELDFVWGTDAINPTTRQKAPIRRVRFHRRLSAAVDHAHALRGLWFRARAASSRSAGRERRPAINSASSSTGSGICSDPGPLEGDSRMSTTSGDRALSLNQFFAASEAARRPLAHAESRRESAHGDRPGLGG